MWLIALVGIRVNPSMIGSPSSRIGAIARSPASRSPTATAPKVSRGVSRSGSGTSGSGGGRRKRMIELISSGDAAAQSR